MAKPEQKQQQQSGDKVAILTGATGIQGRALLRHLHDSGQFKKIYAVSRRKPDIDVPYTRVPMDLTKRDQIIKALDEHSVKDATHLYHVAFSGDMSNLDVDASHNMFKDMVEGLEEAGNPLQVIYLGVGSKYYGYHIAKDIKTKSPFREDDSRHMPPNHYYECEDYLKKRVAEGAKWYWTSMRPGAIIGPSQKTTMSLLMNIALYGTICKELNIDMRCCPNVIITRISHVIWFPGYEKTYGLLNDVVDVDLLAEAQIYVTTHSNCANEAFNCSNGDVFRYCHVWPKIAAWFGLETDDPLAMELDIMMKTPDKPKLWAEIQEKHGLEKIPYEELAGDWKFADANFKAFGEHIEITNKLRRYGFTGMHVDTDAMFLEKLGGLADMKWIPDYRKSK